MPLVLWGHFQHVCQADRRAVGFRPEARGVPCSRLSMDPALSASQSTGPNP